MGAHAEFDPASRRHSGIAGDHFALHLDGAAHGVNDTGELDKKAVAGGLDDAPAVLGDLGVAQRIVFLDLTTSLGATLARKRREAGISGARSHQRLYRFVCLSKKKMVVAQPIMNKK